jgi:hypothetical protein
MLTLLAGIGAKIAGNALFKKGAGFFSAIPKPVWEALAVIGYVLALLALHQHYAHQAIAAAKAEQKAADDKQLQRSLDNEATLRTAIARQNAAIADLTAKSKAQQKQAVEASQAAAERAKSAEAVSDRLKASSRSVPAPAASCEPSAALKEQWQ